MTSINLSIIKMITVENASLNYSFLTITSRCATLAWIFSLQLAFLKEKKMISLCWHWLQDVSLSLNTTELQNIKILTPQIQVTAYLISSIFSKPIKYPHFTTTSTLNSRLEKQNTQTHTKHGAACFYKCVSNSWFFDLTI